MEVISHKHGPLEDMVYRDLMYRDHKLERPNYNVKNVSRVLSINFLSLIMNIDEFKFRNIYF